MKLPIEVHEENLRNMYASLARKAADAVRVVREVARTEAALVMYEAQIASAKAEDRSWSKTNNSGE